MVSRRVLIGRCAVLGALVLAPSLAIAQTGSIAGVVKDTTESILPGMMVVASSPALIEKVRTATTDEKGQHKIIDLRPGIYTVTFTLPGFSSDLRPCATDFDYRCANNDLARDRFPQSRPANRHRSASIRPVTSQSRHSWWKSAETRIFPEIVVAQICAATSDFTTH
jgi:hypothetical protein